jgi:hypothetical protein
MGAWGPGNFENDDAVDWLRKAMTTRRLEPIERMVWQVASAPSSEYLEASDAAIALAAGEIVAALRGRYSFDASAEMISWIEELPKPDTGPLAEAAAAAVGRVLAASELAELWRESGSELWTDNLQDLLRRLSR